MIDFSLLKREADMFVKNTKGTFHEQLVSSGHDQFILVSEREAAPCKVREAVDNMQVSLDDITPFDELVEWLTVLSKSIDRALSRGAKIRWITEKPMDRTSIPKSLELF
jgi:hypothetical protein